MDMGLPLTTGDILWAGLIGVSVLNLTVNVCQQGGLPPPLNPPQAIYVGQG